MSELLDCDEILEVVAPEPVLTDKGLNCPATPRNFGREDGKR